MIESADRQFGVGNWTLMQDNARPHVSKETLAVLKELAVDILPEYDLNIIVVVWAIMEKKLK